MKIKMKSLKHSSSIVISQPMYFPWLGIFEQILLSDIFIFYDDVQFSKGSFTNRVQIKTKHGIKWLTVPLNNLKFGQNINDVMIDNSKNWKQSHLDFIKSTYKNHKYYLDVINIVNKVFKYDYTNLAEISEQSIIEICKYFDIEKEIYRSSALNINSASSERVLNIVNHFNCKTYITGHGAKNYLDHNLFEINDVEVKYINYALIKYPQLFGEFNPYVSILDLIANMGQDGINYFKSKLLNWKEFLNG